jgi:methionyl-tRNA formyltransferase
MRIDAGLDTGDMLLKGEIPILPEDTATTLAPKLADLAAKLIVETLPALKEGRIHPQKQDDTQATHAPILKKEDGWIDFQRTAKEICNRWRGFQPWPGAFTSFRGKNLNVTSARPLTSGSAALDPGALCVSGGHLLVGCGHGTTLELLEVQPEGKKRILAKDFINGYRPNSGEKLGQ